MKKDRRNKRTEEIRTEKQELKKETNKEKKGDRTYDVER